MTGAEIQERINDYKKRKNGSKQIRNKEIQMKKNWYCVHAIFYFELMECAQDSYLVYENVYLIRAVNSELAQKKIFRKLKE